jgi:hypothetical protein
MVMTRQYLVVIGQKFPQTRSFGTFHESANVVRTHMVAGATLVLAQVLFERCAGRWGGVESFADFDQPQQPLDGGGVPSSAIVEVSEDLPQLDGEVVGHRNTTQTMATTAAMSAMQISDSAHT